MVNNSDIVQTIMTSLINISGRKTTKGFALTIMDSIVNDLKDRFELFHHLNVKDTRFLEDDNPITVMKEINDVSPEELGAGLQEVIVQMNTRLGDDAGHFFIKELSRTIGSDNYSVMKHQMGVDLSLLQLEHEVAELEKRILHKVENE